MVFDNEIDNDIDRSAPEVISGRLNPKSDVWSFAVVCWEVVGRKMSLISYIDFRERCPSLWKAIYSANQEESHAS